MAKLRRTIGKYGYRKRFMGRTCKENLKLLIIKRKILIILLLPTLPSILRSNLLANLINEYRTIVEEPGYRLTKPLPIKHRTIDSFDQSDIPNFFRFRNADQLRQLFRGLNFPEAVLLDNNVILRGEEVILAGLMRLSYPIRFCQLMEYFGGDVSILSRSFSWFINHIYDNFKHLVVGGLESFVDDFPTYAAAIKKKVIEAGCDHITADHIFRIFGFIDCTIFAVDRPGGGPADCGVNAPRHSNLIQQSFYTGWKHIHGLKIQTVTLPNGLIADVYGPVSVRHNDLFCLGESDIHDRLVEMQQGVFDHLFALYGDSAYPIMRCLLSRHELAGGGALTPVQITENDCMSSVRESIEWVNADIKNKFAFTTYPKSFKLLKKNRLVKKIIIVACILTNCYKCLNACQTAQYFGLLPPDLEDYLNM